MVATVRPTAKLCHACDDGPGIRRLRARDGFRYVDDRGKRVADAATLARIRALAVPPAWEDVWICPKATGHIQATGRDAKGRKQYRYHAAWHARRGDEKFGRMGSFGRALARVRERVEADLARPGLPREKVLAAVVRLLDQTHLRVGNAEYRRDNGSYGLSTLLDRHVSFAPGELRLRFRGKSGVWHERAVSDPRLARIVRACRDVPGQHLFQYRDDRGAARPVGSADVNAYIRATAGGEFTAKDFRTWAGTMKAAALLAELPPPASKAAGARAVVRVVKEVAGELGNTPAVCRKSYIHPKVIAAYLDESLAATRRADEAQLLKLLGG
jgi:DNA topoisomerase-1